MSEIENLNQLQEKRKDLYNIFNEHLHQITNRLYEMLIDLNTGPAQLLPLASEEVVDLSRPWRSDDTSLWVISKEINFVNQDPKSKSNYDFGSGFSLYITNQKITLNHGSCGEWGADDKGQLSRLYLMTHIFENEKKIIEELDPLVREALPIKKELSDTNIAIDRIERDIRLARERREKEEVLAQLIPGKYICKKGYHWVYPDDGSPSYKKYHYYNFEKIEKVTQKRITTTDAYWGETKWRDKEVYIIQILRKDLFIVDSTDAEPEQEEK